jgi:hypothetical protein
MTRHGIALLTLTIIAIAAWAYNVNYNTKNALQRVSTLRAEIAEEREILRVLRVEWAYLNAPDRLAALVAKHNEALRLIPMTPEHFGMVAAIPYPPNSAKEFERTNVFVNIHPRVEGQGGVPLPPARPRVSPTGWIRQ